MTRPPFHVKRSADAELLRAYEKLLLRWADVAGLISAADLPHIWERHIMDSLRATACLGNAVTIADAGSGAGLPGIPLAVAHPDRRFLLIEPKRRRVAFLELAIETLGIPNAEVVPRALPAPELRVDACLARALAPAPRTWELCSPSLSAGGRVIYFAGRDWSKRYGEALAQHGVRVERCDRSAGSEGGPVVMMTSSSQVSTEERDHDPTKTPNAGGR